MIHAMPMMRGAKPMTPGCSASALCGPTVSAGFARGVLDVAVARGAARVALLAEAGLAAADLADQDARIPLVRYVALMRAGQRLSGDPALGLHYGEAKDIAEVSIVGLIGQASTSGAEAFAQLNRYVPLIVETQNADGGPRFSMVIDREGAWLVDNRLDPNSFPELTESAFAQLICGPRRYGEEVPVKAVQVTHADPGYRDEYERIFRAPVTFGATRNAVLIDAARLVEKPAQLPRYVFGVLNERADALLAELEGSRSVRGRVEGQLMPILHTGQVSMDAVAAKLALSRQTLFRKLKAEGVTFEQVLDELRHKLAVHYLGGRKVSVNETAYLVGFSDPAAFSRAFKRWTGASPSELRAAALAA